MAYEKIKDPENYVVNHRDGNKSNNAIENLEWCLQADNIRHARGMEYKRHKPEKDELN